MLKLVIIKKGGNTNPRDWYTTIMKKFLSYALSAIMIVAMIAVSVSAVEFVKGDGYNTWSGPSYADSVNMGLSPVTMTVNEDGSVTVEQGGYYRTFQSDNNYGGVATAEKVGLDGLEVTINFEEVPVPTNDCWFGLLLLQNPYPFNTADMAPTGGYNPLIRFNVPNLEFYSPTFTGLGNSDMTEPAAPYGMFALQSGDTLKMSVKYKFGQYFVTYVHNDMVYEVPADKTIDASNLFVGQYGGKAHVVVTGTLLGDLNTWKYTVSVKEGVGITDEQLAAQEFELSKGAAATDIETYASDIEYYYEEALKTAGYDAVEYDDIMEALYDIVEARDEVAQAEEDLGIAADADAIAKALDDAVNARIKARDAYYDVEWYAEDYGIEKLYYVPDDSFLFEVREEQEAPVEIEEEMPEESEPTLSAPNKTPSNSYTTHDEDEDEDEDDDEIAHYAGYEITDVFDIGTVEQIMQGFVGIAITVFISCFIIYMLPTIFALITRRNRTKVILFNIFLGWTFVMWIICIVWAFKKNEPEENAEDARAEAVPAEKVEETPVVEVPAAQVSANEVPVVAAARETAPSKFCGNCGQKLDINAKFCNNCGTKVDG